MAINDDILKRQREEIRRRRKEAGEEDLPEPPKPAPPKQNFEEPANAVIHFIPFRDDMYKRFAQTFCGRVVARKSLRTLSWLDVTCSDCKEKHRKP